VELGVEGRQGDDAEAGERQGENPFDLMLPAARMRLDLLCEYLCHQISKISAGLHFA
jgi:hypothetical protein